MEFCNTPRGIHATAVAGILLNFMNGLEMHQLHAAGPPEHGLCKRSAGAEAIVSDIRGVLVTFRFRWLAVTAPLLLAVATGPLAGQENPAAMLASSQRSLVTRAELTATLDSIDRILKAGGYSSAFRDSKRTEADAIRRRLVDGDLTTGDPVLITVLGDDALSKAYVVSPTRTLLLAGTIEIPVKGVLRSELEGYVTTELKKYLREPNVKVTTSMRIQLSGAVSRIGFFSVPASTPLTEVLMSPAAGNGVLNTSQFEKSTIVRGDKVIVDAKAFKPALTTAKTLDELNLQAGDEIKVAAKSVGSVFTRILGLTSALGGLIYLGIRIF